MKFFTLFSGFGGVDVGLSAAGHQSVGGIEYDDKIANVARMNGLHVTTDNVLTAVPDDYPNFDWLHASPPCPNFSNAKANAEETPADIALAEAVANWIITKLPRIVTLENVYQYRNSQSWVTIAQALHNHGYLFNYWHVNMADYGVPQTRQRMIVIARRDGIVPQLPPATHAENPVNGLFGMLQKWVGWYEAIEDLIPTLPDSQFAKWQLARLPDEMKTLAINPNRTSLEWVSENDIAEQNRPMFSLMAGHTEKSIRTFIMDAANPNSNGQVKHRWQDEPVKTMTASDGSIKAFIVSDQKNHVMERIDNQPAFTVDTRPASKNRASVNGRIVQMTPRALARFQSFPDWYGLPDSKALACRGIGNALPPLFMQRLGEWING